MRILVCGMNYAPDLIGVAKYTTELCESLAARGHDVRVITAPPYYPDWVIPTEYRTRWYRRETLNDVAITRAPIYVPQRPSGGKRLVHHASFFMSSAGPLLATAVRWRPDIVFAVAPSLMSAPMAAIAARAAGATSWLHVQDLEVDAAYELGLLQNKRARQLMLKLERTIFRAFDRVSTISRQMMRRLELKGLAPERLREVRNWVDTRIIAPGDHATDFRARLNLASGDIVALYSGAMSDKQGLELIIEAAARTAQSHGHVHYVLCGNGPYRSKLVREADGLRNVHFLDLQPAEQFPELLNTANIHLLPQKAQAADLVLPSKISGMLASGRPIVVMAEPDTGIAMETAGAGLVIAPGDSGRLADAVITLAEDSALRARLGQAARMRAEQKWDRVSIIQALEQEFLALDRRSRSALGRKEPILSPLTRAREVADPNA